MKKTMLLFFTLACLGFLTACATHSHHSPFDQLNKELKHAGISKKDLKAVNKELENLLGKGVKQEDIAWIVKGMSKNGMSGNNMVDTIKMWSDVINGGGNHKKTNDLFYSTFGHGKKHGLQGNDFATILQNALRQNRGDMEGGGSNADLNDLIAMLERNGLSQKDLKAIEKQLGDMLKHGGNKDMISTLLQDMSRNGLNGNALTDAVDAWHNQAIDGIGHQRSHSVIEQVLEEARERGIKDEQLAAMIQDALRQQR
jgi:hypothetical protein